MVSKQLISIASVLAFAAGGTNALAQSLGTAFTYQGELSAAGAPASGTFDLRFRLFDAASGGNQIGATLCSDDVNVANGRFAASLDFGAVFTGQMRFLEIQVRADTGLDCSDDTDFTALVPLQELTAAPNAAFSLTADSSNTATNALNLGGTPSSSIARLDGNQTFTGQLNFTNPSNTFQGLFSGNGAGLTNLNGGSINAGTLGRSSLSADVQGGVGTVVPDLSQAGSVETGASPLSVAVSGSFAYVANYGSDTLQVFNISNPAAPTLVGSAPTGLRPFSVAVSGSFAYVANLLSNTLQVFNISNPAAPTLAGSVATGIFFGPGCISVAVSGSFAYVANYGSNTLQVFNISNPAEPTLAGSVATGIRPYCVAVSGSFAYVVNQLNTLQIFDISNPTAPTLAGSVATGIRPRYVAVSGSYAYVVNEGSGTLQVFNISNPAAPTLAGSVATGEIPTSVAVSGSFAYVANFGANTLQIFNISSPTAPTLAGSVTTNNGPVSLAVSGAFAYVGSNSWTLQVFKALGVGFGAPLAASSLAGVDGSGLANLDASKITTGALAAAQIPSLDASKITTGTLDVALVPNLDASKITTGILADARLSTNVARLDSNQTFTGANNFTSNVGIGTAASQAILDVRGSGNFRNGHVAYFQNNDATGSGIAIQINATRTSKQNNFATFYNAAGAVVGRIEGFDLQAGDWVPPPDLPLSIANGFDSLQINSGVTVRPTADWFNPGSLPSASLQGGRLPTSSLVGGRLPSSSLVGGRLPSSSLVGGSPPSLSINWTAFTFNFNPGSFPWLNFDPGAFPTLEFDPGAFPTLAFDAGEFPTLAFNAGTLPSVSSPITLSTPSISFTLPTEADIMPLTTWAVESNLQGLIAITPMQAAVNVMSVAAMRAAKDGGITYGSKGADYAEYLMKLDPKDNIGFGEVVGIFGGRISRKTDGAERVMVISQAPAVVGNQPPDAERSAYEMVAFMGQVPVAVVGGAKVGDFIAASGQGNGVAVAIHPADLRPEHMERIVGRAWANSVDDRFDFINTHIGAKEEAAAMLLDREIQKNAAAATATEALRAQNQEIMARLRRVEELLSKRQH